MAPALDSSSREGKDFFPGKKRIRPPITKNSLKKITEEDPLRVEDLKGFQVAWAGFMRIGESHTIYSQSIERMQILDWPDSRRHQLTTIITSVSNPSFTERVTLNSDF